MVRSSFPGAIVVVAALSMFACDYDVPISAKPSRRIDQRLLGTWTSSDLKDRMTVRQFDDFHYLVSSVSSGEEALFRAYHSDVSGSPLITVQDITTADRKYFFVRWRVGSNGVLSLEGVNDAVVPTTTRSSAGIVKLLRKNAANPALFLNATNYTRDALTQTVPRG